MNEGIRKIGVHFQGNREMAFTITTLIKVIMIMIAITIIIIIIGI